MKLKILKENNKDYNLSILDFLRILDPSKTGKFLRILLNELKFYERIERKLLTYPLPLYN